MRMFPSWERVRPAVVVRGEAQRGSVLAGHSLLHCNFYSGEIDNGQQPEEASAGA